MARAVIALGANLGDAHAALAGGLAELCATDGIEVLASSSTYRTAPVGGVKQPDFLNAVAIVETSLSPADLLARLHEVEAAWHRMREVRWGPRTLDLDLIDFSGFTSADPSLIVPHPRAYERAFVLVPWLEIEPAAVLPGHGPIGELVTGLGDQSVTIA